MTNIQCKKCGCSRFIRKSKDVCEILATFKDDLVFDGITDDVVDSCIIDDTSYACEDCETELDLDDAIERARAITAQIRENNRNV